jgi:hypothetical protein
VGSCSSLRGLGSPQIYCSGSALPGEDVAQPASEISVWCGVREIWVSVFIAVNEVGGGDKLRPRRGTMLLLMGQSTIVFTEPRARPRHAVSHEFGERECRL